MIYTPDGGAVAPEYAELVRQIQQGDGMGWPGDPRMWLGVGILKNKATGKQGRRLEVWRTNEDGSETMVAHWLPSEQNRVIFDLARMRADSPGHVDVLDRIDAHNDALEKKLSDQAAEHMMETLDHAIRIHVEQNNPRHKFFLNGDPSRGGRA